MCWQAAGECGCVRQGQESAGRVQEGASLAARRVGGADDSCSLAAAGQGGCASAHGPPSRCMEQPCTA